MTLHPDDRLYEFVCMENEKFRPPSQLSLAR